MASPKPARLHNTAANSAPRSGEIGVLPIDPDHPELVERRDGVDIVTLRIAVACPSCGSYSQVEGQGIEFRNVTRMLEPTFWCSACSWRPSSEDDTPQRWRVWYQGRVGGTLLWAMNEEHLDTLLRYIETSPKRRAEVEFHWEYNRLMQRLPNEITSGRVRNDVVSLLKKLKTTRPRRMRVPS